MLVTISWRSRSAPLRFFSPRIARRIVVATIMRWRLLLLRHSHRKSWHHCCILGLHLGIHWVCICCKVGLIWHSSSCTWLHHSIVMLHHLHHGYLLLMGCLCLEISQWIQTGSWNLWEIIRISHWYSSSQCRIVLGPWMKLGIKFERIVCIGLTKHDSILGA